MKFFSLSSSAVPPLVSVLPSAPVDGQEIHFQSSGMATSGTVWHLRYRLGATGNYKWEFVGGPSLWTINTADFTTASVTYVDDGGGSPLLTTPLAGDYVVRMGVRSWAATASASARMGLYWGTAPVEELFVFMGVANVIVDSFREIVKTNATTGMTVKGQFKNTDVAATCHFVNRTLSLTPIRLG